MKRPFISRSARNLKTDLLPGTRKRKDVALNSLFWAMPDLSNYVAQQGGLTEVGKAS